MPNYHSQLSNIQKHISRLHSKANDVLKRGFPVGTITHYRHGSRWREVEVIEHVEGWARVKVRGPSSEYYLDWNYFAH